jgi:hypothetical protein
VNAETNEFELVDISEIQLEQELLVFYRNKETRKFEYEKKKVGFETRRECREFVSKQDTIDEKDIVIL